MALYKRVCACVSVDFKMPFPSLETKVKELMKELKEECEALSLAMWMEKVWVEGERKGVCVCVCVCVCVYFPGVEGYLCGETEIDGYINKK